MKPDTVEQTQHQKYSSEAAASARGTLHTSDVSGVDGANDDCGVGGVYAGCEDGVDGLS